MDDPGIFLLASFPGSPPPLYFIRTILFTRNYCVERREGKSLGGFDHVRTLMTRSVSIVSTYESPKERERSLDQRASRLFGVLSRAYRPPKGERACNCHT